jgi:SagB-type dehydrogenase family enzyme
VSGEDARRYHERTKHTPASVRAGARMLDWANRPYPFKEYEGLEAQPLDVESALGRLLRWGAGVVRSRTYGGVDTYYFRTYSSAGALYPVEVYVAKEDGLFHFHPRELVLRRLREGSFETSLILTGILSRTAWKYDARGYRHLWWDAGTMLANFLALAEANGVEARVQVRFDDEGAVNELLGVDGEEERALAQLPLEDVERVGEAGKELERVLRRRGSVREFALEPISRSELAAILGEALAPIPADMPPYAETYLVVNAVEGVEPGAYRFEAPDSFELLRAGSFRREAGFLVLEQELGARAAATIFFLADLDPVLSEHGERGYRWAQLEGGIRTGRVYIGAFSRGLAATGSTFYDDEVTRFFGLDPAVQPMLAVAVGRS